MFLKLNVIDADPGLEQKMLALFDAYSTLLDLRVPYNPEGFLGANQTATGNFNRAIVETTALTHVFRTTREIQRVQVQMPGMPVPTVGIQERVSFESWIADNNV